jgi:hypothetical protein
VSSDNELVSRATAKHAIYRVCGPRDDKSSMLLTRLTARFLLLEEGAGFVHRKFCQVYLCNLPLPATGKRPIDRLISSCIATRKPHYESPLNWRSSTGLGTPGFPVLPSTRRTIHNSHYASSAMQRCSRTRTFSSESDLDCMRPSYLIRSRLRR